MLDAMTKPWDWRRGRGGVRPDGDHRPEAFHAYDANNNAACDVMVGLISSIEEPNEGSLLCAACIEFVQANPAGRDRRTYPTDLGGGQDDHG